MSGFNTETICPNCGASADMYQDIKPFDYTSIQCYECGLVIYPTITYQKLKDLNQIRVDLGLPKLKKKPEQDFKG